MQDDRIDKLVGELSDKDAMIIAWKDSDGGTETILNGNGACVVSLVTRIIDSIARGTDSDPVEVAEYITDVMNRVALKRAYERDNMS